MKTTRSLKVIIRSLSLATALSTGLGFIFPAFADQQTYLVDLNSKEVTDLGNISARAINDAGQVVGSFTPRGSYFAHAFITGPNGVGRTDLGTLGGNESHAYGINDAGRVVGFSSTRGSKPHAFITGPNGVGMTDLGTLGGNYTIVSLGGSTMLVKWWDSQRPFTLRAGEMLVMLLSPAPMAWG